MIDLPHDLSSSDYAGTNDQSDRTLIGLNRLAIEFAKSAVEEYAIDPAFAEHCGKINGAASEAGEAHNHSYAVHLTEIDERFQRLDAKEMHEVTGSTYYRSGLYTPGTLMLQPAGYVLGLAAGLRRSGVNLYENSPVLSFEKAGSDWSVRTATGQVTTPQIILATNGHLESFGVAKGRLVQLFLYASMSQELNADQQRTLGGHGRWGITPADPMGTTMRRIDTGQGGHRIITRTCATVRSSMETSKADIQRMRPLKAL